MKVSYIEFSYSVGISMGDILIQTPNLVLVLF